MTSAGTLIRDQEALSHVMAVTDPVVRDLLRFAVGEAKLTFARRVGQPELEWRSALPVADFDLEFYARVLERVFANQRIIRALLAGKSLEEASGWGV
jgi:hypothetical protein